MEQTSRSEKLLAYIESAKAKGATATVDVTLSAPGRAKAKEMAAAWTDFSAQMDEIVSALRTKGKHHGDAN